MRCLPIKCLIFALFFGVLFLSGSPARAASSKPPQKPGSSENTIPMKATTVNDCITVEAVLLPYKPAAMLFGGFVANNYAVVKTTISNHCDDRQFILHNIYFDYRNWALSGGFPLSNLRTMCYSEKAKAPASDGSAKSDATGAVPDAGKGESRTGSGVPATSTGSTESASSNAADSFTQKLASLCSTIPPDEYTASTNEGQVATTGARDVEYQEEEDSEFSPRNKVVKALTLIGAVAQGYAFVGSGGAAMGIGAFNTAFVGSVVKLWPDRRIDQEKYLLSLGYRTDQSTAIAKEDHGSYYAFFPLKSFLKPELNKLFLKDPAVFLNPAEALMTMGGGKKDSTADLEDLLLRLTNAIPGNTDIKAEKLLIELASPCPGALCRYTGDEFYRVMAEKYLFASASLNSVRIVVRGVMTIPVEAVPPMIDKVAFDGKENDAATWTVVSAADSTPTGGGTAKPATKPAAGGAGAAAATKPVAGNAAAVLAGEEAKTPVADQNSRTGKITGKFLSGGTPSIVDIAVPGKDSPKLTDYIVEKSLQVVQSSDASLAFKFTLAGTIPSGTKLTFKVSRTLPKSTTDAATPGSADATSTTITSNEYVYIVSYGAVTATPTISKVSIDNDTETDVWQKPGRLSGTASGSDLGDGTITVSALEIAGKPVTVSDYIGTPAEVPKSSTVAKLDFQLSLLKAVPDGSKVTFLVSTKQANATYAYTVEKPKPPPAKPPVKPAKPAATKPTAGVKPTIVPKAPAHATAVP